PGEVLFDASRTDGAIDSHRLTATIRKIEGHEKTVISLFHARLYTEILKGVVALEVPLNGCWLRLLRHSAVKSASPGRIMIGVTGTALSGGQVVLVGITPSSDFGK